MKVHLHNRQLVCGLLVLGMIFWFSVSLAYPPCIQRCLGDNKDMVKDCIHDPACKPSVGTLKKWILAMCRVECQSDHERRGGTCEAILDALDRLEKPAQDCAQNQWCKGTEGMRRLNELIADLQRKLKDCIHEPGAENCKSLRAAIDRLREVLKDCAQDRSCNRADLLKQLDKTISIFRNKWRRCLKDGSKPQPSAKAGTERNPDLGLCK